MSILNLKLHSGPEAVKSNIRDKSFILTIDLGLVNDGKLLSLGRSTERGHQHFPMWCQICFPHNHLLVFSHFPRQRNFCLESTEMSHTEGGAAGTSWQRTRCSRGRSKLFSYFGRCMFLISNHFFFVFLLGWRSVDLATSPLARSPSPSPELCGSLSVSVHMSAEKRRKRKL